MYFPQQTTREMNEALHRAFLSLGVTVSFDIVGQAVARTLAANSFNRVPAVNDGDDLTQTALVSRCAKCNSALDCEGFCTDNQCDFHIWPQGLSSVLIAATEPHQVMSLNSYDVFTSEREQSRKFAADPNRDTQTLQPFRLARKSAALVMFSEECLEEAHRKVVSAAELVMFKKGYERCATSVLGVPIFAGSGFDRLSCQLEFELKDRERQPLLRFCLTFGTMGLRCWFMINKEVLSDLRNIDATPCLGRPKWASTEAQCIPPSSRPLISDIKAVVDAFEESVFEGAIESGCAR